MSEHTDAARLEALRDSMRPRVEGEERAIVCEWCATAWRYSTPIIGEDREALAAEAKAHSLVCEKNPLVAQVARLTSEVERLTKEKARVSQLAFEEGAVWGFTRPDGAAIQAEAVRRYPLPTDAPEVPRG